MRLKLKNKVVGVLLLVALVGAVFAGVVNSTVEPQKVEAAGEKIIGELSLAEHKALYEDSYRAASDEYHASHGFDPSTNVVTVDTYNKFVQAYKDETVTKIIMLNNISSPTTGSGLVHNRRKSIEIDGGGHKLLLYHRNLGVGAPTDSSRVFHLHDLIAATQNSYATTEGANYWSFIGGTGDYVNNLTDRGQWYFRFGNVSTDYDASKYEGNNRSYSSIGGRFARVNQAEVTMYGHNTLVTGSENFYLGSMVVEPNTVYNGTNCKLDYSVVWFVDRQRDGTTGINGEFTIGDNSFVYLRNTYTGTSFPAIYAHYSTITVGEGAYYNANMMGRAVSNADSTPLGGTNRYSQKQFIAKKNSHVNLLSRGNGSVVRLDYENNGISPNMQFKAEEGAEVYIYGATGATLGTRNDGIISMNGNGCLFELDKPKMFEIRNNRGYTFINTSNNNTFRIKNSDINTWINSADLANPANYSYERVENLSIEGTSVTSSDPDLASTLNTSGFRRINGLNVAPELIWDYVTDANKTYQARVSLGMIPTGQFDKNGVAIMTTNWAKAGQANVSFTDTLNNTRTPIETGNDGYAKYTDTEFQKATEEMQGSALRGKTWQGEVSRTKVIDVTPPEPIKLVKNRITTTDQTLEAIGLEPNSKVFISVNGGSVTAAGAANGNGEWSHQLANTFNKDDKVQIFLEDTAEAYPEDFDAAGLEATHTATGNRNPVTDVTYKDATFKAATIYTVEQVRVTLHVRQMVATTTEGKEKLVQPTEGYAKIVNTDTLKYDTRYPSGYELTDTGTQEQADFAKIVIDMEKPKVDSLLKFQPIIPAYYKNHGYIVTDTEEAHSLATPTLQTGEYQYNFADGVYEKWLTIYITPTQSDFQPYSWDYGLNDLGIKTR
ncbi:hypothetical protein JZO70_06930 [Enterococcus sp. 669A]|uniref:Bacterial Ig domain-containing protein n=1 Tax=Candidatus Enterococcus moelleringii TaxID=2815325 RepID=A0ABS3L8D6_9ENTE|nr:pectate lyase-like adhesive domain-containing protein [Enterococcus sp. 669A]MBO1305886.1 hypothetical protein [Enterococcus sp. 669A]